MTARSTTGATFRRTATGWETATTTSKVARTARNRTILSIEAESYPVATSGGNWGIARQGRNWRRAMKPGPSIQRCCLRTRPVRGLAGAWQVFRLVRAEIDDHANAAQRLASHADVAAVQDQPVMRVQQEPARDDAHETVFDLTRRLAGRDVQAIGGPEHMGVDGQR